MSIPNIKSLPDQVSSAYVKGGAMMLVQAWPVNALNRVSVVGCSEGLSLRDTIRNIYQGAIDHSSPSLKHFHRGILGHFLKEIPRLAFKPVALMYKPFLDDYFGAKESRKAAWLANFIFSGVLAKLEMAINPFDTWRVIVQSGRGREVTFPKSFKDVQALYAGSLANGARQFGTWLMFGVSGSELDQLFKRYTCLDPYSTYGISLKSPIQALLFTSVVYIFERVKNELQYARTSLQSSSSAYLSAFRHILTAKGGPKALTHGFAAKFLSNAILTCGANWLIKEGKAVQQKIEKPVLGTVLMENTQVRVSKVEFLPKTAAILHTNSHNRVIVCLQGGDLVKVDAQGKNLGMRSFIPGEVYWSTKSTNNEEHGNINEGETPVEVIIVEVKK